MNTRKIVVEARERAVSAERLFLSAATVLLFVGLAWSLTSSSGTGEHPGGLDVWGGLSLGWVAALALMAIGVCLLQWQLASLGRDVWIGAALAFFGLTQIALAEVVPLMSGGALRDAAIAFGLAGRTVTVVLIGIAGFSPALRGRPSLARVVVWSMSAMGLLAAVLMSLPSGYLDVIETVVATAWVAAAVLWFYRLWRDDVSSSRVSGTVTCLALAQLVPILAGPLDADIQPPQRALLFAATLYALVAVQRQVVRDVTKGRQDLVDLWAERQKIEEREHDMASALLSIGGALAAIKTRPGEGLAERHTALVEALSSEVKRLQGLLRRGRRTERSGQTLEFDVDAAVLPLVTCARATGVDVQAVIPAGMRVIGSPAVTADVVYTLLNNAAKHAEGSLVRITASREAEWVVLRVSDDGPGIDKAERSLIFERGGRGTTTASGTGFGLHVASRLMREEGGDLWLDDDGQPGATFAVCLRAATSWDVIDVSVPGWAPGAEAIENGAQLLHAVDDHEG